MPLISIGSIVTAVGVLWKFRKVVVAFYKWKVTPYQQPETGQVWAFARFSPLNSEGEDWHTFTVTDVDDERVYFTSNWIPDSPDESFKSLDAWHRDMLALRGYILKVGNTVEDEFFGDASED